MTIELKGRRIALIGGAGFIGHNLALALKKRGVEVSIIDSLFVNNLLAFTSNETKIDNRDLYLRILNSRMELLRDANIPIFIQDARDYHALSRVLQAINPQAIVHLAAVAHANVSNKDPYSTFDHSFRTLENALDWARGQIEHFVYFSSSMVYGNFKDGFVTEDSYCEPLGIYGALKFGGEKLVIGYHQVFDLPYTIIRPSALYGERCVSRRVGQIFIESAMRGSEISINGDGSDRLDFTYIEDLVDGVIKVLENKNSTNQIFNITNGAAQSINEMVSILKEYFPGVVVKYLPKEKLMPDRGTLSIEKARKLIGYKPRFPLAKGFVKYIQWYKEFEPSGKIRLGVKVSG